MTFFLLCISITLVLGQNNKKPDKKPYKLDSEEEKALKKVNEYRKIAGLKPVEVDEALSKGCKAHAEYLVKNSNHPSINEFSKHYEDPKLPGYTEEGEKAGKASDINTGVKDFSSSIDQFMATFYHRIPILRPHLKEIGFGYAKGGKWGYVSCLDVISGRDKTVKKVEPDVVIYPVDKQKDVPYDFASEKPNPIPKEGEGKGGYPITITFWNDVKVTNVKVKLMTGSKNTDFYLSTPENPATSREQWNTICIIPKASLQSKTTYIVDVSCKIDEKDWQKKWTFETKK